MAIEGDPDRVLPVFRDNIDNLTAVDGLRDLGTAATAELPRLRELLTANDRTDCTGWTRLHAVAVWRIGGDPDPVLPVLTDV